MDTVTHIVVGGCLGEALAGKTLGKKAMFLGAVFHSLPDIDVITYTWMSTPESLLSHRGFTHSFLFLILLSALLAWVMKYRYRSSPATFLQWMFFLGVLMFLHDFIDAFNNYGVGWFEPFSHTRISFDSIYVVDPFFSIWPFIAFVALLILKRQSIRRRRCWQSGLFLGALYLVYSLSNKNETATVLKKTLQERGISYNRYFTTPAPLQNWLWYVVAGTDSGYYTGYWSVFEKENTIDLQYFPRNDWMLEKPNNQPEIIKLVRFSRHFYTLEKYSDTLVFNDLRFGQIAGWETPLGRFAFHYYLQYPEANRMVVQRGRFSGWNKQSFNIFINRVTGNKVPTMEVNQ